MTTIDSRIRIDIANRLTVARRVGAIPPPFIENMTVQPGWYAEWLLMKYGREIIVLLRPSAAP